MSCDYAGDSGCAGQNDASRDPHILLGKVLRITRDGGIPATNPYTGTDSARCNLTGRTDVGKKCQETFASGLRNPFRFAFDPNASGTRFFINDVGEARWEEVEQGTHRGGLRLEPLRGQPRQPEQAGLRELCRRALHAAHPRVQPRHRVLLDHRRGLCPQRRLARRATTTPTSIGDYVCGKIFKLKPKSGGGFTQTEFVTGLGGRRSPSP